MIDVATKLSLDAADVIGLFPLIWDAGMMNKSDILEWIESHIKHDAG